jgi:hypothetical protein
MRLTKSAYVVVPFIFLGASASTSINAADVLAKVPFSGSKDPANFAGNCRVITQNLNKLMAYAASTCQAKQGVVMIKASSAVHTKKQLPGFYALAFGAAGWAVNEDYYGQGAQFVVGNDKASQGCLMLSGTIVAYTQDRIKNEGKDMQSELVRTVASAKKVECPDFLK